MQDDRVTLTKAFACIADGASTGHYLDRLIVVYGAMVDAGIVGVDYLRLLQANREFLRHRFAPAGLRALHAEVSQIAVGIAVDLGLSAQEIRPIVWGVDIAALELYGLEWLRRIPD